MCCSCLVYLAWGSYQSRSSVYIISKSINLPVKVAIAFIIPCGNGCIILSHLVHFFENWKSFVVAFSLVRHPSVPRITSSFLKKRRIDRGLLLWNGLNKQLINWVSNPSVSLYYEVHLFHLSSYHWKSVIWKGESELTSDGILWKLRWIDGIRNLWVHMGWWIHPDILQRVFSEVGFHLSRLVL